MVCSHILPLTPNFGNLLSEFHFKNYKFLKQFDSYKQVTKTENCPSGTIITVQNPQNNDYRYPLPLSNAVTYDRSK